MHDASSRQPARAGALDQSRALDRLGAQRGWDARGTTPDVRPPYFASYGPHSYDPAANWAAERRASWGVRAAAYGGPRVAGAPGFAAVGFGPEGGYGEFGRGAAYYGTAQVVAGAGDARTVGGAPPRPRPSHAGRAPRGYQRSDERIEEDVNETLTRDPALDATDVEVHVESGDVTLSGSVSDRWAKRRAEDDAWSCAGVREVRNRLTTRSGGAGR